MAGEDLSWHERASARLLEARKDGRLRSKKVRSGCVTCKARRVKCDEQKPKCGRCLATGRRCEGYTSSLSPSTSPSTSLERDQIPGQITIASPPAQFLGLSNRSRRKLDFFMSRAGPQLAGRLDQDFWCSSTLQIGLRESFAMDSILAISTLYEYPQFLASFYSNPQRTNAPDAPPLNAPHSEALIYYNRAIKSFKQSVADGRATPLLALMSCSLFLCIELIRDNVYAALELYKHGAQLLRQFGEDVQHNQDSSLLGVIRLMFSRMSALAPVFSGYVHKRVVLDDGAERYPPTIASLDDARNELFALMIDSDSFVQDADTWMSSLMVSRTIRDAPNDRTGDLGEDESAVETMYGVVFRMVHESRSSTQTSSATPSSAVDTPLPACESEDQGSNDPVQTEHSMPYNARSAISQHVNEVDDKFTRLLQRQTELLHRLDIWRKALHDMTRDDQRYEKQTIYYLLVFYHSTFLWLSSRLDLLETNFDTFTPHFEELLRYAELYLDSLPSPAPTFTFEIGATPALFLAAIKCRVPSLRRRALALMLKAPKKECMHGSFSTAEFARGIVELEEADTGLPKIHLELSLLSNAVDDSIVIPERRRIRHPELMHNVSNGTYELKGERLLEIDGFMYVDVLVAPL